MLKKVFKIIKAPLFLIFILLTVSLFASKAMAATLTVTKTADTNDGTCDADCSLREAMTAAAATDTIVFNTTTFPTASPATITVSGALPAMSAGSVTIDASNAGVILDGGGTVTDGISITSNNNVVKGLRIQNFTDDAIEITSGTGITIGGNNTTGSGPSGEGNVLVSNGTGIDYTGGGVTITGNYVGTDQNSTGGLGNSVVGIWIHASGATVGGSSAGLGNVVSGNTDLGIHIGVWGGGPLIDTAATIIGNYIGTNAAGTAALGNGNQGITFFNATNNILGGSAVGEGNVISGNATVGLDSQFSSSVTAEGNYIGTRADGTGSIPNGGGGIRVINSSATLTLGMSGSFRANKIGANTGDGLLVSAGTLNLVNTLDADDNINLTGGTVNMGSATVNLSSDWTSGGATINAGTSTVNLDGTGQTLSGSTTFYNLNKTVTSTDTLTFPASGTQTIATGGSLTLKGASGQLLSLRSSSSPTRWNLSVPAAVTKDVQFVNVQDADATDGDITANDAVNNGGNDDAEASPRWIFAPTTISGTVYTDDDELTPLTGKLVRLLVNGTDSGLTATTDGSGNYTINAAPNTGNTLLVYLDNETEDGTTVTVSNGGTLSALNIYQNHVVVRHDNGGVLSNANLSTATNGDADIQYSVDGSNNLTVTGSHELFLPAGHSYTPGGNVTTPSLESRGTFNGGAITIDISDYFILGGGTFTATSGTMSVVDDFTISGGSFIHNNGTIHIDGLGIGSPVMDIGATVLNHLTFSKGATPVTITGALDVNGNLVINSVDRILGGNINVAGNVTSTDAVVGGTSVIVLDGSGAQVVGAGGGGGTAGLPSLTINKSDTVTLQDTIVIERDWTYTAGTVNAGSSTVSFQQNETQASSINSGAMAFNHVEFDKGAFDITVTGTMNIDGNLTFISAQAVNTGTFTVAGNLTSADVEIFGTAAITLDGTGTQNINVTGDLPDGTFTINKASGTAVLTANFTTGLDAAGQDLTLSGGTLDLNGFNLTVPDVLTVGATETLQLEGGETVTTTTTTLNTGSTVLYDGGGTYTGLAAGDAYSKLTFNGSGTWTLDAALDVNGNLTITAGTLDVSGTNYPVNVAGNWSNGGTFTPRSGTVVFDGTNQTLTGSTTFNNFSKTESTNDATDVTLTFDNTATQTINGLLTLDGLDADDRILLVSDSPGNQWGLTANGTFAIDNVRPTDSDASGGLTIVHSSSTDGGNNLNWGFTVAISGTVYTNDDEATAMVGETVRLLVNGSSVGTAVTDGSGNYTINAAPNTGQTLLVYLDSNGGNFGTTVSVSNGGAISGLNIYQNHVVVRHDNGGALTNADMGTATNGDTDIRYTVSGGNLSVTGSDELYIPSGHSFTPGGNVTTTNMESLGTFNGGAVAIDINGDLIVGGGGFTSTSGTMTIVDDITISGGSFVHNSGTVHFDGTGITSNISTGSEQFNHVQLTKAGFNFNISGTMDVNGNLTINSVGSIDGTLTVAGNVTGTDGTVGGNGNITLDGGGAQTLDAGGGGGTVGVPSIVINKGGGTLTLQDTISVHKDWTHTAGTVSAGTSTVSFNNDASAISGNISAPGMAFNNVIFDKGSSSLTVTGTMDIDGNLTISGLGNLNTGTVAVAGNLTTTDSAVGGDATVLFNGAGAQILGAAGGTGGLPSVDINKGGGTLTLQDTIHVSRNWTRTLGNVSAGSSTVSFNNDAGTQSTSVNSGTMAFNDVEFDKGGFSITVTGTMDINGNLTFTSASNVNTGTFTVAGNLTSADVEIFGTAAITLDGTGTQNINVTGDLPDGTFTINKASGTAVLTANFTTGLDAAGQDLTLSGGTLDLNGFNLTVPDVLTVGATETLQLEGGETVTTTTTTLNTGSTVLYDGGGTYTGLAAGDTYSKLTFNGSGTWTLDAALDVNGNLTITAGTLDVSGTNYPVNVAGNWSNGGTFTPRSGTVVFDGTNQTLTGSTTFNNFTKTESTNDATDVTLTFDNTATQTINGTLTLDGLDADDRINLVSDSPGTQWDLVLGASATKAIDFVDVQDSDAAGSNAAQLPVNPASSVDSGNNIQWFTGVTGTVYTDDDEATPLSGKVIRLLVNGASVGTAVTNGAGVYSIAATPSVGDTVLAFIDNETEDGTTVTVSNGGSFSNFNIYQNHVVTRQDNSGALTNANLSTATNGDTDIQYTVSGGNLTVSGNHELHVLTGHSFTPGGNVTAVDMDINGTFNPAAFAVNVSGNWDATGGVFTSTGTVTFNGTADQTITSGGAAFNHLTLNNTGGSGSDDVIIADALDINGNLTITDGDLDIGTNNPTVNTAGNVTIASNGSIDVTSRTADWTFDGTTTLSDSSGGGPQDLEDVVVNGTSLTLGASTKVQTLTVTAGTLDLGASGYTLEIDGTGTPLSNSGTFTAGTSTVQYTGTGAGVNIATLPYSSLRLTPTAATTYSLGAALSGVNGLSGNLNIDANATLNAAGFDIDVAGDWTNAGTLTSGANTVTFDGTGTQSITSGGSTFNNLTITNASNVVTFSDALSTGNFTAVTPNTQLRFTGGTTNTISGTLNLNGQAAGTEVVLRSTNASQYVLDVTGGAQTVSFVDVQYSDAGTNNITANLSTNSGNNDDAAASPHWIFSVQITGTVYTDEGTTPIADGAIVRLLVNGVSVGTDTTTTGAYAIPSGALSAGDAILVYIDNHASDGVAVTVSDGTALAGFDIYAGHVIARHDNSRSLSNANMDTALGAFSDTDLLYSVASGNLTVSGAGTELYIPLNHSFTPGGNVTTPAMENLGTFVGGSGTIDVNGALQLTAGAFTATSGTLSIGTGFTISGGTFTHNAGTVAFDTGSATINIGSAILNDLSLAIGTGTLTVTGTVDVDGDFAVTSLAGIDGGTIAVAGNATSTDTDIVGTATILLDGGGNQTLGVLSSTGDFPNIAINKTGGTLTLEGTIETADWTYTAGTVNAGTSTVRFDAFYPHTISSGAMRFNDVELSNNGNAVTIVGTMDINGNLTLSDAGNISGGTMTVAGNLTSADAAVDGTTAVTLDGTGTQNINVTGDLPDGTFTINKTSGTVILLANFATGLDGAGQDLTISQGTLDLNGFNLTVPDVFTVNAAGTLQLEGGETVTTGTTTLNSGSTVLYDGGGTYAGLAAGNSYANLTFNNAGGTWAQNAALDVNGNLTITAGTLNSAGNAITLAGNWSNSGTYASGANTVTFDGGNQSLAGSTTFNHFSKIDSANDATDLTLTFDNTATQTINGTFTINGLDADDRINLVSDSPGNPWSLVLGAGAVKSVDFVDVQDSDAAGSDAALIPVNPTNAIDSGNNIQWFGTAVAATSAAVEISPNAVAVGSTGNAFTYDLLPTIGGSDTGIDQIILSVPAGYGNLVLNGVSVGGTAQIPDCVGLGAGEYCASISGQVITVTLGTKVTTTLSNIRLTLTADAPTTVGGADFTSTFDDTSTGVAAQAAAAGNADGDAGDNNSITVQVVGRAVTSVLAEVSPNAVPINSTGNSFAYDMLPTINAGDTGINQIALTVPAGHSNLSVTGVSVGGTAQTAGSGCPTPAAGEYCSTVSGQVITLTLGTAVTTSLTNIRITFTADAPSTVGSGNVTATVDDAATITAAQAITAGNADGDAADADSIAVATGDLAATSALSEISPNTVVMSTTTRAFILDILPAINAADTGIDQLELTAPSAYANLNVTGVSVAGANQTASITCPTPGAGEYCAGVSAQVMTVTLGSKLLTSSSNVQIRFTADTPGVSDSASFLAKFNDTATAAVAPQSAAEGNADGDSEDANSLSVTVQSIDTAQSLVSAAPSLIEIDRDGDGNPYSTITITPKDPAGLDLGSGLNVVISVVEAAAPSGKPAGVKEAAGDPFGSMTAVVDNGDGTYSAQLSSAISGIAAVNATVNGVLLQSAQTVTFTAGEVLKISKTANKKSAVIGDVITYEVAIQNTTTQDVSSVTLNDKIPPGFKYLQGSSLVNGQPAADPSGNQTRAFNLGTIAAWVDQNGNGLADTGDAGNITLSYQLVIGSGVKPGAHVNLAQAVDFAAISNQSRVKVRVDYDPIFDLSTVIGKVFFDKNQNGYQDRGEAGIAGVRVALDNGTYVVTDDAGRYHFPGVKPGQRLLKIHTATLPPGTTVTTEEARIAEVSRGLLTKVNFGVVYDIETEHIGRPGKEGLAVSPQLEIEPTQITGHLQAMQVLVNGDDVKLPVNQAHLGVSEIKEVVEIIGENLIQPILFSIVPEMPDRVKSWRLEIKDAEGGIFRLLQGQGAPPEEIRWDGKDAAQKLMEGGAVYSYQFKVDYKDGSAAASTRRLFGVNKTSAVSLNLLGSAFAVGSAEINEKTEKVLDELAETLKKYPNEPITIEGHTDNTGNDDFNLQLSKARAETAMHYLVEKKAIDKKRFSLKWFGEGKPIASNGVEEGRAVNRRVEIVGTIKEVKTAKIFNHPRSEAVMRINGLPVETETGDRFSTKLRQDVETLILEMAGSGGEVLKTTLIFPKVEILAPAGQEILVFGEPNARYLALPLPKGGEKTAGLPVASYRLQGKTEAENQVWVDGKAVKVGMEGRFETDILLKIGENLFTIVAANPQRVSRMMTLKIHLSDKDEQGRVMMAIKPIPQISVLLPPKGKVLSHTQLPLRGMTDPGNAVWVNETKIAVAENGTFSTRAELQSGKNTLVIKVVDAEGYSSRIEREVTVNEAPFFLMALADGEFGRISTSGYLEGAGADQRKDYYAKGRLAYYLKGKILGKYLITSAFDTGKNEFERMFQNLNQAETDRFFTNIDPDKFYPVYGDESTIVYDAQSRGKFYLAIEGEDLNVLVGNYKTDLNDTELAAFNRTLYGARAEYRSLSKTRYGAHDTKVIVFGAEVRQAHVQNTFRATGGSLYYLSEKNVIEGSEQVRIEVRDQNTGLVLAKIDQVRDADYSFKYEEGRILFRRPISGVVSNDLLLAQASLQGHPVFVLVDFEYEAQNFDKRAVGGRVRQQVGDHLAIGGTAIEDAAEAGDYALKAADAELRLGRDTTLVGEYAQSRGKNSATLISEDGGISFTPLAATVADSGSAYKAAVRSNLSEWFGAKARLLGNAYYKRLSPGFFSNGTLLEQGTLKYGGGLKAVLNKQDTLRLRYDFQEVIANANAVSANQVGAKQVLMKELEYGHRRGPFLFTAGFQDKRIDEGGGVSKVEQQLAGAVNWQVHERFSALLKHQQLIRGADRYRSTLGLKAGLADWLDGVAEGSFSNAADTALLGLSARIDDRSTLYINETFKKKEGEEATWASVAGGDRMLTPRLKLYGEYGEERGPINQTRSLWGLDQRFGDDKKWKINLNYERSYLKGLTRNTTRDAAALSLRYLRPDGSRSAHRVELRLEKGTDKKIHRLTTHQGELKILSGLTLFGKFNFSDTKNRTQNRLEARFTEAGGGVAYRPIAFDRVNFISKYTFLMDQKPDASGPMLKTASHVTSVEIIYDISRYFQWVEKYAVKLKKERQSPRPDLKSRTDLWINRLNFHVTKRWDIAGEYRILKQFQANDQLEGYAVEVNRALAKHFRFGVGYNFSRFTDNEFSDNNYDARGWFIRVQGKY